jgi:acyl-CoA reductase-like NAD-dependent aldehyde dehydrogenase
MALLVWKFGPALAAGNSVVVKPAEETPITTLLMGEMAAEFLPPGVFNVITGNGPTVGDAIVRHPAVPMISMTGETTTGKIIYAAAASHMKKLHLELGGPSAVVVFDDADVERFEAALPAGTFRNSGQDCHALSRVYAHESVRDRIVEACVRVAEQQTMGEAFDPTTVIGPLVSRRQRDRVAGIVAEATERPHVEVATGGSVPDRRGFFYPATVLDGVRADDAIKQTEIFGPVITVTSFRDEAEVLGWANAGRFGLSASVWTDSLDRGLRVSEALEAGTVWVNDHSKTVTEMPFGGWKDSGVGRELSTAVIEEHMEIKHIAIAVRDA